jgi:hypothetical protein
MGKKRKEKDKEEMEKEKKIKSPSHLFIDLKIIRDSEIMFTKQ